MVLAGSAAWACLPSVGLAQGSAVSPTAAAAPETERSPEYERLFSHDAEHQPLPVPWLTLEVGALAGAFHDGSPAYTARVMSRFTLMFSLGIAVTESPSQVEAPEIAVLFPVWLLEIDDFGLYAPMGLLPGKRLFVGGGASVPVARRLFLRVEASWVFRDERARITGGLEYRIF